MLDRAEALARVGGDIELLKEIAALFVEDYPRSLDEIRQALAACDAKTIERSAHGLKGAVANFGARAVVDEAYQIEQLGRSHKLDQVPPALAALEQSLASLQAELASLE